MRMRKKADLPHKASALLLFPTVHAACAAVAVLAKAPVDSVELMDRASLRSVEGQPGLPEGLEQLRLLALRYSDPCVMDLYFQLDLQIVLRANFHIDINVAIFGELDGISE